MSDLSNTELAEKVRGGLPYNLVRGQEHVLEAWTALGELLSRLDAVTRERDEWKREAERGAFAGVELIRKRRAAEADRDRYKAALEQIVGPNTTGNVPARISREQKIAYAALRAAATEEEA